MSVMKTPFDRTREKLVPIVNIDEELSVGEEISITVPGPSGTAGYAEKVKVHKDSNSFRLKVQRKNGTYLSIVKANLKRYKAMRIH